jgi:PPK2 family polyphosphate:nucleotide phosphotransferase
MKREARINLVDEIIERCFVDGKNTFKLNEHLTDWTGTEDLIDLKEKELKKRAKKILNENLDELSEAQELLYATGEFSMLLIFQAMDAAGKDGTIKHVMSGVNPQGCQVSSFKKPSSEELAHNFLWRYVKRMPEKGMIGIFNRSYYEEVLVVKVNPELLNEEHPDTAFWEGRYEDIRNLEKHLARNNTIVLKFFLNVSKEEQKNRFLERLNNPEKHWKFSDSDLTERSKWDQYQQAFEEAINATATKEAPWWVIPADHKWVMRVIVSTIITETILGLKLEPPEVSPQKMKLINEAREQLEG